MAKMVDAGLGKDLLDPEGVTLRDGTPVTVDKGFQRGWALLKTRHGGLVYRLHEERCLFLNSLNNIAPAHGGGHATPVERAPGDVRGRECAQLVVPRKDGETVSPARGPE